MDEYREDYTFDGKFEGSIPIVGRTGCGKTTFIQRLGKNKLFGSDLTKVFWVLKIILSKEREDSIRDGFEDQEVQFSYPNDIDDFNYLIGNFMQNRSDYIDNNEGESLSVTGLLIMDDVSGLTDKSEEFSNFLTVSRKYGFSCLYVFHNIYPGRQSWEMMMSQTHIFNFFPGSIHSSRILKTLSLFASRQKNTYLPNQQIWLNRLYFQISNSKEKKCLTIDTREVNQLGPGKFRTSADNGQEQTCYFNRNKSDSHFNSYTAKRAFPDKLVFSIVKVNSDFSLINKSLEIEVKTNSFLNDRAKRQHQQVDRGDFSNGKKKQELKQELTEEEIIDWTHTMYQSQPYPEENQEEVEIIEEKCTEKNQNLSPPKKSVLNRQRIKYTATRMKYSPTRVKSRNFLSNISYTGISKGDFYNEYFILDIFILLVKNLNPFSQQRKVSDKLKHDLYVVERMHSSRVL